MVCLTRLIACTCQRRTISCSFQAALRAFFQPIKTDDPRLDFYTVYKREATEYDVDYVKKYDEDLNTTLIFVCPLLYTLLNPLTWSRRRACSLQSAPLLSLMSIRNFSLIPTRNLRLSSVQSFSPSTTPPSQTNPPPFHPSNRTLLARSSLLLACCTRAF